VPTKPRSSTSQSKASDLTGENSDRIEGAVQKSLTIVQSAMQFRIKGWTVDNTARARAEALIEEMIEAGNMAAEVEETLVALMTIKQFIDTQWEEAESLTFSRVHSKYTSQKEKMAPVIRANPVLFGTKKRVDSACTIAERAVERLTHLHQICSRAVGFTYGPQ